MLCSLLLVATAWAVTYKPTGGTNGKFTFSGQVSGTLKLPKKWNLGYGQSVHGCRMSNPDQLTLFFFNVKLPLDGHKTKLSGVEVELEVGEDGDTESLVSTGQVGPATSYAAAVDLLLNAGGASYAWASTSGTITTNARGTSGSFSAGLVPSGDDGLPADAGSSGSASQPVNITGSWSSCQSAPK